MDFRFHIYIIKWTLTCDHKFYAHFYDDHQPEKERFGEIENIEKYSLKDV